MKDSKCKKKLFQSMKMYKGLSVEETKDTEEYDYCVWWRPSTHNVTKVKYVRVRRRENQTTLRNGKENHKEKQTRKKDGQGNEAWLFSRGYVIIYYINIYLKNNTTFCRPWTLTQVKSRENHIKVIKNFLFEYFHFPFLCLSGNFWKFSHFSWWESQES